MENTLQPKVKSLLGFSARARKILSGYGTVEISAAKGKAYLMLIARDCADNSKEKAVSLAMRQNIEYRIYGTMEELSHVTGTAGKGIFAVTDKGFAESILKEIDKDPEGTESGEQLINRRRDAKELK